MKFAVYRLYNAGLTDGFVKIDDDSGFRHPIPCAGVRLELGGSVVDITRDEACVVAGMVQDAARDA
jgi:hypothetical protein